MSTDKPDLNKDKKKLDYFYKNINQTLVSERKALFKILEQFKKAGREKEEFLFSELKEKLDRANQSFKERLKTLPLPDFNEDLPILSRKDEIIEAVKKHPVVIVTGETGSGKTTQLPKLCLAAGRGRYGKIACTQPRRIAALSVSERIAEELGLEPGREVACKVRFKDQSSDKTIVKLMTDGVLLAESLSDPYLNQYDTIIIDEAHERSLNIDFLLGFLTRLIKKRRDLKLIITSATIDSEKFSQAFANAPILKVSGRMYPVEVRYRPQPEEEKGPSFAEQVTASVNEIMQEDPFGDILIFLPTEQDIKEACQLLERADYKSTVILPLYARLTGAEQKRVFKALGMRKIVVATNVAETSLTIPGIRYVIDTGVARIPRYLPGTGNTSLPVVPISRSSAKQRMGRCGRVANGVCIRLYSEESYEARERFSTPEILRANLADVLLKMTALKLGDIKDFPFIDRPADKLIKDGYDTLLELGAIIKKEEGQGFKLTPTGKSMALIPLDPRISRMLIAADKLGCTRDIVIIAAGITAVDPRERPEEKKAQALQAQQVFKDPFSDFIILLRIWERFDKENKGDFSIGKLKKFTQSYFLSFKRMREWRDLNFQIFEILEENGFDLSNKLKEDKEDPKSPYSPRYAAIHKAILSGHLSNIAKKKEGNIFISSKNKECMIFPGSSLFNKAPEWIVSAEMVETSRLYARCAAGIEAGWVIEMAGDLIRENLYEPHWEKNQESVMAFRRVSYKGLILSDRESRPFGPQDPKTATEIFIQSALIQGELKRIPPFLAHNQKLIASISEKEDRLRRRDYFAGERALFDFYAQRIEDTFDIRSLLSQIKKRSSDSFLRAREEDLILKEFDTKSLKEFPRKIPLAGKKEFPCHYTFKPGEKSDGVAIHIPANLASEVEPHKLEWLVPGLLAEKIEHLLKNLPKLSRVRLNPLGETAKKIARELKVKDKPLALALSHFLYRNYHIDMAPSRFSEENLPDHLRFQICLTDEKGSVIHSSRNPEVLRRDIQDFHKKEEFEELNKIWGRFPVEAEDLDKLPEFQQSRELKNNKTTFFIGFLYKKEGVEQAVFSSAEEARKEHAKAIRHLLGKELKKELKDLEKTLVLPKSFPLALFNLKGKERLEKLIFESISSFYLEQNLRTYQEFTKALQEAKKSLYLKGENLKEAVVQVLEAKEKTLETFLKLEKSNNIRTKSFIDKMRLEMQNLLPENFPLLYTEEEIRRMPRYLKALAIRSERATMDFSKDELKSAELEFFENALKSIVSELESKVTKEKQREVEELFWMIEEFKISLFAQEIKTLRPVSAKRLKNQIEKIKRLL